jgi:predicted metalloprotease
MIGLKQQLEKVDEQIKDKQNELRSKNIFQGAACFQVTVPKNIGKALGLKKDYFGYILFSTSTNGAYSFAEDKIDDVVNKYNKKYDTQATVYTQLL